MADNGLGDWFSGLTTGLFQQSLTVDTGVMRQKAEAVQIKIQTMQNAFSELEATLNRTQNYWVGEAGDAHRSYFTEKKPEMEEIIRRLSGRVQALGRMASTYDTAEQEITEASANLPADVIQ